MQKYFCVGCTLSRDRQGHPGHGATPLVHHASHPWQSWSTAELIVCSLSHINQPCHAFHDSSSHLLSSFLLNQWAILWM